MSNIINLPCNIGDKVYVVCKYGDADVQLEETYVDCFLITKEGISLRNDFHDGHLCYIHEIGIQVYGYRTVFLNKEDAEKLLS
jgi:hypothetical protein